GDHRVRDMQMQHVVRTAKNSPPAYPGLVHTHTTLRQGPGADQFPRREQSNVRHRSQRDPDDVTARLDLGFLFTSLMRVTGPSRRGNPRFARTPGGPFEPFLLPINDLRELFSG